VLETFEQMVSMLPVGVVVINAAGKILYVNEETEVLFGYTRPQLEGQLVHMLLPPNAAVKHPNFVSGFFDDPRRRAMNDGRELPGLKSNGSTFMVIVNIGPLKTSKGFLAMACIQRSARGK
jgi:PAS domain S-box-containing protein